MGDSLRLVFDAQGDLREAARQCEVEVFRTRYGIPPTQMVEEYAPYDHASVWLAVVHDSLGVVGSSRIVLPNAYGLKSLADVAGEPWLVDGVSALRAARLDITRVWDVATLSRLPVLPNEPVMEALLYGLGRGILVNEASGMIAVLDSVVRILLQRRHGLRYSAVPGTSRQYFMGSPSEPVLAHAPAFLDNIRLTHPEAHRTITAGWGLDDVQLPTLDEHRLPQRVIDLRPFDDTEVDAAVTIPLARSGADAGRQAG